MRPTDPRAVDNPISAIFDLADDVNREAPRMRRLVLYAGVFVGAWLALDLILILQNIVYHPVLTVVLVVLFVLGLWTLLNLRRLNDFLDYYTLRHSVILSIRQEEPGTLAPAGRDPMQRLLSHLASRNNVFAQTMGEAPRSPSIVKGRSGISHEFDHYSRVRPGLLWRLLGLGNPGYQLFIRQVQGAPGEEEMLSMVNSVEDVCRQTRQPASRAIMLWKRVADDDLQDEAYERLNRSSVTYAHSFRTYTSSLQLIIENEDGSYEFMPYVADA